MKATLSKQLIISCRRSRCTMERPLLKPLMCKATVWVRSQEA